MEGKKEVAKVDKKQVELTEVTTQTATAFKLPDGDIVDVNGLLLTIANWVFEIKKSVA